MAKKKSKNTTKSTPKTNKKKDNSFDYKVFIRKNKLLLIPVILIIVAMLYAFSIRSGPITLDGLDERIEQNTLNQIQNLITQQINQQYPDLNEVYKQELIQEELQKVIDSGRYELQGQTVIIDDIVKQNSDQIKSQFKADNGQTYLNAIDPYYFMRISSNYLKTGTRGDTIIDGVAYDSLKLAPVGGKAPSQSFHLWLESLSYKLYGLEETADVGDTTRAIFLLPVIFAMLCAIPCFLIVRRFTDDFSAFLSTILLLSIGTFVSRTVAGFVDTDAYNVFFPLLILMLIIYGFLVKNIKITILLASIAGFFQGIFLWSWSSSWFIFLFVSISLAGYVGFIILSKIIDEKKIKFKEFKLINDLTTLMSFVISSEIFSYLIAGKSIILSTYNGIFSSLERVASISQTNIWPNVYSSVAELNPASFSQIVSGVGGKYIFLIALLGLVLLSLDIPKLKEDHKRYKKGLILASIAWFFTIVQYNFLVGFTANSALLFLVLLFIPVGLGLLISLLNNNTDSKIFLVILLSVWVAGTIYMSLNGVRFILLLAPAFAISFGLGLYYIAKGVDSFFKSEFKFEDEKKSKIGSYIVVAILFLSLFAPIYSSAQNVSKNTLPNFDDAWYSSMYKIKDNSSEDAIITSWWDFGHFFAAVAERGVTFDGGSQTTPRSHWVGKFLMENDEEVAHDILQMLVCQGNEAHNLMLEYSDGTAADSVKINKIIYNTFGQDTEETRAILSDNSYYSYTDEQIDSIMEYLSCEEPRENFVIASEDMVGKAGVWAHWGSWDFTKKYTHDNYRSLTAEQIAQDIDENVTLIEQYITELQEIDSRSSSENVRRNDLVNRWFAPYPSYIPIQNRYEYPCTQQNTTLVCQNGIIINTLTNEVSTQPQLQGQLAFSRLLFPTSNNTLFEAPQGNGDIDVLLIPNNGEYNVMLMQYPLGGSMFTKMFYLQGFGLNKFEAFDAKQAATGLRIYTWKTLWD